MSGTKMSGGWKDANWFFARELTVTIRHTMMFPSNVALNDGEGHQNAATTGGDNSKEEGQFDCQMNEGGMTKKFEGSTSQEVQNRRQIPRTD